MIMTITIICIDNVLVAVLVVIITTSISSIISSISTLPIAVMIHTTGSFKTLPWYYYESFLANATTLISDTMTTLTRL